MRLEDPPSLSPPDGRGGSSRAAAERGGESESESESESEEGATFDGVDAKALEEHTRTYAMKQPSYNPNRVSKAAVLSKIESIVERKDSPFVQLKDAPPHVRRQTVDLELHPSAAGLFDKDNILVAVLQPGAGEKELKAAA